eukprot:m.42417 g.42417  ORF g.42417 m.42417 type:complete len:428 (-) comp10649_c0_seq1:30-1313(-)
MGSGSSRAKRPVVPTVIKVQPEAVPESPSPPPKHDASKTFRRPPPVAILEAPPEPHKDHLIETKKVDFRNDSDVEQVNQYKLFQVLGSGSSGHVRFARSEITKAPLAIKCVSRKKLLRRDGFKRPRGAPTSADSMRDLQREIALLKKLRHEHIVQLFEVLEDEMHDTIYLVFEFMQFGPVLDLTAPDPKPFSEDRARNYFRQVVLAVEYLHHQNVVHRDIKPANILLHTRNVVKLADFGLSLSLDSPTSVILKNVGTPLFLSPEAVTDGAFFDGKSADIWAMGVTLFCFLFARPPWRAPTNLLSLYRSIREDPLLIDSKPRISQEASDVLHSLLDRSQPRRITINQLREHPFVTRGGRFALSPTPSNCGELIEVTDEDLQGSICSVHTRLETLVAAKVMLRRQTFKSSKWRVPGQRIDVLEAAEASG